MSMKHSVHPQLNLYETQEDGLIYLIFLLCLHDFHLFLVLLSDSKKKTQKRTLKMHVKVIPRKTYQGENLDMELKDKYETRLYN